jgi:hypothetical protein
VFTLESLSSNREDLTKRRAKYLTSEIYIQFVVGSSWPFCCWLHCSKFC